MTALIDHIFRLLTLRHDGRGLALTSYTRMALIFGLAILLAFLRWGDPIGAGLHGGLLVFLSVIISPAAGVAYALVSTGVDAMAIPVESAVGESGLMLFALWELIAAVVITYRVQGKPRHADKG